MKKILLLCLTLLISSMSSSYAKSKMTKAELAQAASEYVSLLEGKAWMFLPKDVTFKHGVRIDNLQSEKNQFALQGDTLLMMMHMAPGTVHDPSHATTRTSLNYFNGKLHVQKNTVTVSKDNKTVINKLEGRAETTKTLPMERVEVEIRVEVETGKTYLSYTDRGDRNGTYSGVLGVYEEIILE